MKTSWMKSFLTHLLPMGTRLLPCVAAALLAATVRAEEPTADWSASFDGSDTCTGWFTDWDGEKPSEYVETPNTQGFKVTSSVHPYKSAGGVTVGNSFSIACYVDLSNVETNGVFFGVGGATWQSGSGFALAKTATNEVSVVRYKGNSSANCVTDVSVQSDDISRGTYVLYTMSVEQTDTTTTVTLTAGATSATSSLTTKYTPSGNGIQVGSCFGGIGYITVNGGSASQALNAVFDEIRGYNAVLTADNVTALVEAFPSVVPDLATRTLTGDANWTATGAWLLGESQVDSITSGNVELTLSADSELTVDTSAALDVLTVLGATGDETLTLAVSGANTLSATTLKANVNVVLPESGFSATSAIVAAGKSLTLQDSSLSITVTQATGSRVLYDYSAGTIPASFDYNATGSTVAFGGTQSNTTFLGGTNGTVEIAKDAEISVPHLRFLNTSSGSNNVTLNVNGTLNVTGVTTNPYGDRGSYKGALFGHWGGTGTHNINAGGFLNAENTYTHLVYTAGAQTFNIAGGHFKTRALLASSENATINLTDGGILELATWPTTSAITQNYGYGTVKAYSYESSTGWTNPQAVVFTDADNGTTLDPNGLEMAFSGTITGAGKIVVNDSATTKGSVNFASATLSGFTGSCEIQNGSTALFPAGAEGTVTVASGATVTLVLSDAQVSAGYTASAVTGDGTIKFVKADGTEITEGVSGNTYLPPTPRWTATAATGSWSDTNLWSTDTAPTSGSVVLDFSNVNGDTTITIDATSTLDAITVIGASGELTFEANGSNALTVSSIAATADANVTDGVMLTDAGTVSIAEGATLTVPNNFVYSGDAFSIASGGLPSRVTGPGTLALDLGTGTTVNMTGTNSSYKLGIKVLSGTLNFPNGGADGPGKGRAITVSGSDSILKFSTGDAGGWNYADGQKVALYDGGTLLIAARDTFVADVEMCGGEILLSEYANGGRGLDLFHANIFTVLAADGATADAPTESTFTHTSATGAPGRKVLIRNGDLTFDVAANARLTVDATLVASEAGLNAGGTPGQLIKNGDGELVLTAANTYNTATQINAGVVTLSGDGVLGTGAVTIAAGAVMNTNVADGVTRALTSYYGSLSSVNADAILRKSGAGVLTLDAAFAGKLEVLGGTVAVGERRDITLAALAEGATITLTRATAEQTIALNTTLATAPEAACFTVDGVIPESVVLADGVLTITPARQVYYWVPAGTDTNWTTVANWRIGSTTGSVATEAPTTVAEVVVPVAKGDDVTMTLSGDVTILALEVIATGDTGDAGTLTIEGGTITASNPLSISGVAVTAPAMGVSAVAFAENATLTTTLAAGATWALNKISGTGTFIKEGEGTLKLAVPSAEGRIVVEDAAITINDGILQTWLTGSDTNPIFKNATIAFGANADGFQSHGWLGLEETVTINTAADITFAAASGVTPSFSVTNTGTLVKEGTGTFTWDLLGNAGHANPIIINNGTVAFAGTGSQTAVISGAGQVKIAADAAVTFTATNTYTGGTNIAEGAKLTVPTNGLGSGAVTGAGTFEMPGYPTNATVRTSLAATEWMGRYINTGDLSMADTGDWFGGSGNANSGVEFTGTSSGYLKPAGQMNAHFIITGSMTFSNGNSSNGGYTFNGALSGEGTLATINSQTDVLKFMGDTSGFTGTITVAGGHCIAFGDQTDDDSAVGMFVVATKAVVPADKYWSAVNGVKVLGTIGGTGTIGTADGTNGKLILTSGATVDTTGGTLSVSELDALPDAVSIKATTIPTTTEERVDVMKVKTLPSVLTDATVTLLNTAGESQGTNFTFVADGEADENGYTMLQVKMKVAATDYTVTVSDTISSLSTALAGGVFGEGATEYPTDPMNLTIDFGNVADGAEAVPGTFDFDNETDIAFVKVTVKGSNGGTITKSGAGAVTTADWVTAEAVEVKAPFTLIEACTRVTLAADTTLALTVEAKSAGNYTLSKLITGDGVLAFETGENTVVTVTGENTYTGGTVIAEGATVKMSAAGVLGTGAISGAGTVYYVPTMNGNTPTAPTLTDWTGTLWLEDITTVQNFNLAAFGNENSTIGLKDVGATTSNSYLNVGQTIASDLILLGEDTISNGSSNMTVVFTGDLSGSGTYLFAKASGSGAPTDNYCFTGDLSAFTGTIQFTGNANRKVVIGSATPSDGYSNAIALVNAITLNDAATINAAGSGVKLNSTTVLTGAPTFATKVDVLTGATFNADPTKAIKLAAGTTLSLPTTFNVVFPEGTTVTAGKPIVIFDRADTDALDLTGKAVVVKVVEEVVNGAMLVATADGDIAVQIPAAYEAEITADIAWEDIQWTVGGEVVTSAPTAMDDVVLTPMTAGCTITCANALALGSLHAESDVTLCFSRDCVTQEDYEAIPTTVTLLTTTNGVDATVHVTLEALKYGAMATVTQTETTDTATLTLPDSAIVDYEDAAGDQIAVNFTDNNNYLVSGVATVGYAGYETAVANWTQVGTASGSADIILASADGTTQTLAQAMTYSSANTWSTGDDTSHQIIRGYLDDSNNGATVSIEVPEDWKGYTAIIYCGTDTASTTFGAKQINGTWYTYSNGTVVASEDRPSAGWGDSNSRSELIAGTNTMIVTDLSGTFTVVGNRVNNGPRGCISGIQLIEQKPIYELVPVVTATVTDETATWADLTWMDEDGNEISAPDADDPVSLLIATADATLDVTGAVAKRVSVQGNGNTVRFIGTMPTALGFSFSKDTTYRLEETSDTLPPVVEMLPGVLRYEYAYDASTAYATIPGTTTEFAAGFTGSFTANGGGIAFSAGEVALTSVAATGTKTAISFEGTSATTVTGEMLFGQANVTLSDKATVTTPAFSLAEGDAGRTTTVVMEDKAVLTVTGATNIHEGSTWNTCSLKFAHWNGIANVTLRGNAKLVAEQADLVTSHTGSGSLTIEDSAEVRVKGLVHHSHDTNATVVNIHGGRLLLGDTGIRSYSGNKKITLNFNGGSLGALRNTVTLGADTETALAAVNGNVCFASIDGATLELTQVAPFLTNGKVENLAGILRLNGVDATTATVTGGTLKVANAVAIETLTMAAGSTLAFDAGVLTLTNGTLTDATIEIPVRNRLSEGGYIVMADNAALLDLSSTVLTLSLDPDRSDAEKVLPEVPVVLGTYDEGAEPNLKGFGMLNNTNNAIAETELQLKAGDLGTGLYVVLTGTEVLKRADIDLTKTGYLLSQAAANTNPYHYFTSTEDGARARFPQETVALSHATFVGEPVRFVAEGSTPNVLMQSNSVSIATNVTIDLAAWADAMPTFIRGAVRDLPASLCLISGGMTFAPGVTVELDFGGYKLPDGYSATVEKTLDGIYLVVTSNRVAHAISVNFTDVATPLATPPANPGLYPVQVAAWNDLKDVYSSSTLKLTDLGGVASSIAMAAEDMPTYLLAYTSKVNTSAEASTSMLKVWLSDAAEQTIRVEGVPFDAYRVALIFANDLEGAAYAPIQVGEGVYTMDGEGYTRRDIVPYTVVNASTGLVTLEVAGDEAWGSTNYTEQANPIVAGTNAMVTDILTESDLEITLPAFEYGRKYAGLAALQIVEAPEDVVTTEAEYAYTFDTEGSYKLAELTLTSNGTDAQWESGNNHSLTLTANADVTVVLPLDFVADVVTVEGTGKLTLQVEGNGGAALNTLDASALTSNLTVMFPCVDVEFSAPTGVTTFEAAFNNNGQPYTIAKDATLVLGENSGITTNMEPTLFATATVDLTIDSASEGTLRRNYPVTQNRPGQHGYAWEIILAYKQATFGSGAYWQPDLLVEEGDDIVVNGNNLWVTGNTTRRTFEYRQTGGSFVMGNTTNNNNGLLCSPAGNSALVDGNITITGGLLHTSAILAWDANATITVNVSETGALSLWNKLHAQGGATVNATFSDGGTLVLANTSLSKGGNGTVTVNLKNGVVTTEQTETTMSLPVVFAAETGATTFKPAVGSTIVLNATNSGTGAVEIAQGTVALSNKDGLGSAAVTVKSGAALEVRGLAFTVEMTNTVTVEEGAILSATLGGGVTTGTVKFGKSLTMPTDTTKVLYRLNGAWYTDVTVDATAGTVTFNNPVTAEAVTWDAAVAEGTWAEGVGEPWESDTTYYNGADVTFSNANSSKVAVTVSGDVRPASITFADGAEDTYTFTAKDEASYLTLSGTDLDLSGGQTYDIPMAIAKNAKLDGVDNTYRLIGVLSNGRKTASLMEATGDSNAAIINREAEGVKHGVWCTEGVTLAPKAGEVQYVSAMGTTDSSKRSHLSGDQNVTITGGGTVKFAGRVLETGATDVPFQNKAFSGKILIKDDATLDISMIRDRSDARARDDHPFFALPPTDSGATQDTAGAPLWTTEAGVLVQDGATFRVSGCRSIFGGWANRNDTALLTARPLAIGYKATADFSFAAREQVFPHGFRFYGDGATLLATQNMYLSGGTTFEVAGIGEEGDKADPATDSALDANGGQANADTYGKLTKGITVEVASGATTGLVPWEHTGTTVSDPITLQVGEGSSLNLTANLLTYSNSASLDRFIFKKTGAGALRLMQSVIDAEVQLALTEGILGGVATLSNTASQVTASAGTTLEAGLTLPVATLAGGVTFAIDPTGAKMLKMRRVSFTSGTTYTVASLVAEDAISEAAGLPPIKVVAWDSAVNADTVIFKLTSALTDKGYALEVRTDGLYIMQEVVYVRELSSVTSAGEWRINWYEKQWYRADDSSKMLRTYDPEEGEAVTARFVLPDAFAEDNATLPTITLILTQPVSFANVCFVAKTTETDENGEAIYKTLPVTVTYLYALINETMPTADSALRFTWVPTLVLMRGDDATGLATLTVDLPEGYEYTISNTTVMVYVAAPAPALNINFTAGSSNEPSWVQTTADPCGPVPFAGVYWNNASTATGNQLAMDGTHTVMSMQALPAGVEADESGQATLCDVTYAYTQATTVNARLSGDTDAAIVASYLAGKSGTSLSETVRQAGNMTDAGVQGGWQVRIASVPFEAYDLYIVLAGATEDAAVYPAVRVKVGDGAWRTYSRVNGWTAPADKASTWQGMGGLVKGKFVDGQNVLHLRVQSAAGNALEIAPWDNGQASDAVATSVGLAAIQVVRCDDAAAMERVGTGKWSDAAGWRRTLLGGTETGAWMDATADAPRYASIGIVQQLDADIAATTPYLAFAGSGTMVFKGAEGVLSTGTLDLTKVGVGTTLTFSEDVFAEPVNVLLAPQMTVNVPEDASGTVVNRWKWLNDDASNNVDSTSATIQKKAAGDVELMYTPQANLQIEEGTMWLASNADATLTGAIAGSGGTFGKKGTGTVTASGTVTLSGMNPIRVSQGTLKLTKALTGITGGATVLVDGGTLDMPSGAGFTSDSIVYLNGGSLVIRGTQTNARPHLIMENGAYVDKPNGDGGWAGYQFASLIARGSNNVMNLASAGSGGPCVDVIGNFIVDAGASLKIAKGTGTPGALRVVSGTVEVREGATLTSQWRIGRGTTGGYGSATDVLTKTGAGLWRLEQILSAKGDSTWGQTFVVAEGEAQVAFGGGTYSVEQETPITVKAAARLSGNVVFTEKTKVTFEENAIVRSGVSGVAKSKLTFHTVTFNKGVTFEADLDLNNPLTITDSATFTSGEMTVRLLNMSAQFGTEKQLIAWPSNTSVATDFVSPEAVALDATLEKRNDGLYLVASNASYTWRDQNDVWSKTAGWTAVDDDGNTITTDYPTDKDDIPVARLVADSISVDLTVDGYADAEGYDWNAQALVMLAESGKTLTLKQGATATDGTLEGLNGILVDSDIWKLGAGEAIVNVPVKYATTAVGSSLSVAEGRLTITHPLTADSPGVDIDPATLPTSLSIAEGATLDLALNVPTEEQAVITDYKPNTQTFTGAVEGEGTLKVSTANSVITLTTTSDAALNYEVAAGELVLNGDVTPSALRSAERTVKVAAGAKLTLNSETAMGASTNLVWTLAAADTTGTTQGAIVATTNDARIRGEVVVTPATGADSSVATLGSVRATLDAPVQMTIPEKTTLKLLGAWASASDSLATTALTKLGKGTLSLSGDFTANVPMTIAAGCVALADTGVTTINDNEGATTADWTVLSGATLTLGGGKLNLGEGVFTLESGAILETGSTTTTINTATTLADRSTLIFGEAGNSVNVGYLSFKQQTMVNGIVVINLDKLDPASLKDESVTLIEFDTNMRQGSGVFQLGGDKLVAFAEDGWTLRDTGTSVVLQCFGEDGYYTWAGDTSATGDGNWAKEYWVKNGSDEKVAWPTESDANPSMMLQDTDPTTGDEIPEEARTLDWTMAEQTIAAIYTKNSVDHDYCLKSSTGSALFDVAGDFLKAGKGNLTVERPLQLGRDGALRLLGGTTEFTGAVTASSGDFDKPVTVAGEGTILRFSGTVSRKLMGLLEGDGRGTLEQTGTGTLTLGDKLDKLATLKVDAGNVVLAADDQYTVVPEVTVGANGTLSYAATLTGSDALTMSINKDATAAGRFFWNATAPSASDKAPRLAGTFGIDTLRYQPQAGHLIIDPMEGILPEGFNLEMAGSDVITTALWLGAQAGEDDEIVVSSLTGEGVIGVEPVIDRLADETWSKNRVLTVASTATELATTETFEGALMGATLPDGTEVTAGLSIENRTGAAERTYFRYLGTSTDVTLGTLAIGANATAEVTGTWAGDVTVAADGGLMGSGTVGDAARTVAVPKGAILSGTVYGKRINANGTYTQEVIPSTLTVKGTLSLEAGSVLNAKIIRDETGDTVSSLVQAETVLLPTILEDGAEEVMLTVNVELDEGAKSSNIKLLGWSSLNGGQNINGNVTVTIDGVKQEGYSLRKKADGLYLQRASARFWFILL